jgi:hypothetical protein
MAMDYESVAMNHIASPSGNAVLFLQLMLVGAGIALAALIPPAHGSMIAIPLFSESRSAGLGTMIAAGARIERAGPIAGSLIITADRNAILAGALKNGVLLMPTSVAGCRTDGAER